MRILDKDNDRSLSDVTLYLTPEEAKELHDSLASVLARPKHHAHVSSEDFSKEVTVCIYEAGELGHFNERSRRLIENDE